MTLHIYPIQNNVDLVLAVDDAGYYTKKRDTLFGALDVMRQLYDDIVIHVNPID